MTASEKIELSKKIKITYFTHTINRSSEEMIGFEPVKLAKPSIDEITLVENIPWITVRLYLNAQFKAGTFIIMYIDLNDRCVFDIERKNDHCITADQIHQIKMNKLNLEITLISCADYTHCLMTNRLRFTESK